MLPKLGTADATITFTFSEIASEVARLNSGVTPGVALARLEKSFSDGEFESGGISQVILNGKPWSRDALFDAKELVDMYRPHYLPNFRLGAGEVKSWAERWKYDLPDGFINVPECRQNRKPAPSATKSDFIKWANAEKEKHGLWPPTDAEKTRQRQGWRRWAAANKVKRKTVENWVNSNGFNNPIGRQKSGK